MEQKLDQRIIIPMTRDMVRLIGDFRHAAQVSTRSEAVRILIRIGLDQAKAEARSRAVKGDAK
jgi:hypothetical protein